MNVVNGGHEVRIGQLRLVSDVFDVLKGQCGLQR